MQEIRATRLDVSAGDESVRRIPELLSQIRAVEALHIRTCEFLAAVAAVAAACPSVAISCCRYCCHHRHCCFRLKSNKIEQFGIVVEALFGLTIVIIVHVQPEKREGQDKAI